MWRSLTIIGLLSALTIGTPQTPEVNVVMRDKLVHAQKLLEGVVISDWASLSMHSRALEQLTNDPRWTILKYSEYARHSAAFVRALETLRRASEQRDLDETPKAYVNVTLQCVECHRYLARERIAR